MLLKTNLVIGYGIRKQPCYILTYLYTICKIYSEGKWVLSEELTLPFHLGLVNFADFRVGL